MSSSIFSTGHVRTNSGHEQLLSRDLDDSLPYRPTVTSASDDLESGHLVDDRSSTTIHFSSSQPENSYPHAVPSSTGASDFHSTWCVWKDPEVRKNWDLILWNCLLFCIGAGLFCFGLFATFFPHEYDIHGWLLCILGALILTPGAYYLGYAGCYVLGVRGYSLDQLRRSYQW